MDSVTDASMSAVAWHGPTDQNRYTSDHDTGEWDRYVIPTLEENVSWPFSSARQWSFVDVNDEPLDISRNAHIGSSVDAIPRDVGRAVPPIDHEEHGQPELSSDIHRDDTDICTEPDLSLSETDEDDGRDVNDRFDDIGPSHVNISDRLSYYNTDRGELSTNMVFKDKKHLISAVEDFSVRVARS
ncbi:hypothetical protein F511_27014 [Dorcoceras hygrometricum]|uniref:Uncharacterized protein n=1 Tax=Dorcoceras hygrometricum TaxID=472368 RepID=A0A2Z7BKK0_9LAMI|nr:hypothetical protein F511_27014 [Dorcoceras hygrometricum]